MPDSKGRLTRSEMEQIINGGGTVHYHPQGGGQSRMISTADQLPPEEELVAGDEKAQNAMRESLLAQRAGIDAQIGRIGAAPKPKPSESDGPADNGRDYTKMTVADLREEVANRDIEGRSDLTTKDALVTALEKNDADKK